MIYAYTTPGYAKNEGWLKIGYTERQTVEKRIRQQSHTISVDTQLEWQDNAMYKDGSGECFEDKDFHSWLVTQKQVQRRPKEEWFFLAPDIALQYFHQFASRQVAINEARATYTLRHEQQEAVNKTKAYFESGGEEFLWNAKPRFGKTLTAYHLIQAMGLKKVLVVSNRPSIANSWADDFFKFIGWRGEYSFISDNDALNSRPGVFTRRAFLSSKDAALKMIAFESLQSLKGSVYFGGDYDKLKWIKDLEFDLLIVDESHEGVDTLKTERAFDNIQRKHTLYLSGTPFRQLASADFGKEQIFNWSYADEQEAKENWQEDSHNPYERLPRLNLFTYQMSEMIRDKAKKGIVIAGNGDTVDYAFDLNEFFATKENGKFVHEEEVKKFLHALVIQEKYPFSTPELRQELAHTMWYLNRVASAKALAKLLEEDDIFGEYKVILAVGNAKNNDMPNLKALDQVKKAIDDYEKTITLTVGQLTVGVTIPQWSGVLMLCNMASPAAYMQAAFRAQNPFAQTVNGQRLVKENAYIFDFDPARTLIIFDDFANNLCETTAGGAGTGEERKRNIKRLLNFLPVIGEDTDGAMVELDAAQVLSIPRRLKSQEVVRCGFMSNFLFQNIGNIFSAPDAVREIMAKLPMADEEKRQPKPETLNKIDDVPVDSDGNVNIPDQIAIGDAQNIFGDKIYEIAKDVSDKAKTIVKDTTSENIITHTKKIGSALKSHLAASIIAPIAAEKKISRKAQQKLENKINKEIDRKLEKLVGDFEHTKKIAQAVLASEQEDSDSESGLAEAQANYNHTLFQALADFTTNMQNTVTQLMEEKPAEICKEVRESRASEEKKFVEDEVRAHLRGFSRTLPSFIMAYGDDNLKLANFDTYVEDAVFREVTGITLENFRFLRDGGEYIDKDTGNTEHFNGHLFDETVFDDAIQEFLTKKKALANYFDENRDEDIFDYIPPQKNNLIFTPRWVVIMMVDNLEKENPGCFDDPDNTFADLYVKSGLYIAEIVKRLFKSNGLKKAFPNKQARIRHILEKQVYGMAPTRIIYLIAINYILGFDDELKQVSHNFVEADTVKASKKGRLKQLLDGHFS